MAVGGYGTTVLGLGLLIAVSSWPQVIVARALAWMGRGLRQPIRSAMLAGSVEHKDLGKAFGFHEALDTAGALLGPATAFLLLSTGNGFRTIFWVALVPGVLCVVLFALITRDPRRERPKPVSLKVPMPPGFWRLMVPVAIFGIGNFATAFFTLRAAQLVQPELSHSAALAAAVGFYLAHNAVGAAVSFRPAGSRTGSERRRSWPPLTSPLRPPAWSGSSATAGSRWRCWRSWWGLRTGRQRGRGLAHELAGGGAPAGQRVWFPQRHQRCGRPGFQHHRGRSVDVRQPGDRPRFWRRAVRFRLRRPVAAGAQTV
jgi:MFS family permease